MTISNISAVRFSGPSRWFKAAVKPRTPETAKNDFHRAVDPLYQRILTKPIEIKNKQVEEHGTDFEKTVTITADAMIDSKPYKVVINRTADNVARGTLTLTGPGGETFTLGHGLIMGGYYEYQMAYTDQSGQNFAAHWNFDLTDREKRMLHHVSQKLWGPVELASPQTSLTVLDL